MTLTGGPVLWILLGLAIVAVVTYFERLLDIRRAQVDCQDFLKGVINILDANNDAEALSVCEETAAPVANVVATAIRHRAGSARALRDAVDAQGRAEIGRLDRRLAALAIIAQISPALGLLGTIIGFIRTVMKVNAQELVSRAELLSVSMEALVAAALGLAVAIPVTVMYGSLRVRLDHVVVDLEAAASQIIGYLSNKREEQKEAVR